MRQQHETLETCSAVLLLSVGLSSEASATLRCHMLCRRDDDRVVQRARHVSTIDVEVCSGVKLVKSIYKYVHKGHDRRVDHVSSDRIWRSRPAVSAKT